MIINLTQHSPSPEQKGVTEPIPSVQQLLLFEGRYSFSEVVDRARRIAEIAAEFWKEAVNSEDVDSDECPTAMVGGLPALMAPLHAALIAKGISPCYAISDRVALEEPQPDGSVKSVRVFRHIGWCSVDLTHDYGF